LLSGVLLPVEAVVVEPVLCDHMVCNQEEVVAGHRPSEADHCRVEKGQREIELVIEDSRPFPDRAVSPESEPASVQAESVPTAAASVSVPGR